MWRLVSVFKLKGKVQNEVPTVAIANSSETDVLDEIARGQKPFHKRLNVSGKKKFSTRRLEFITESIKNI